MKRIILFFLTIFFAASVFSQVGTLTVTIVDSEPVTGLTLIEYEFTGSAGNYDISAEVSFNNGVDYADIPMEDLTGAITNITPGGPYSLTWNGMASFPEKYSEETVIRLTATPKYILLMAADPIGGGTATDQTDAGTYEEDAVINIEAEPNTGYAFVEWTAPSGSFASVSDRETTFTMPAGNVIVTANFCQLPDAPTATEATGVGTDTFTANWEAVTGAVTYRLEVSRNEDFTGELFKDIEVSTLSQPVSVLVDWDCGDQNYYYRVKATNVCGTSVCSGTISVTFSALPVTFTYRGVEVTYGTVRKDYGGTVGEKCWLDRNLGASQVATSHADTDAYGDLFQWGRLDDGHQDRGSTLTSTLSTEDDPGHSLFITASGNFDNWRSPRNNNLWQGGTDDNNPCPTGWRVPTEAELNAERQSWSSNDRAGAYASELKWTAGGDRIHNGTLSSVNSYGYVWSSTVSSSSPNAARRLYFHPGGASILTYGRVGGMSVRCVKDVE